MAASEDACGCDLSLLSRDAGLTRYGAGLPGAQYRLYGVATLGGDKQEVGSGLSYELVRCLEEELNQRVKQRYPRAGFGRPMFNYDLMLPVFSKNAPCRKGDFVASQCRTEPQPLSGGAQWWAEWLRVGEVEEGGDERCVVRLPDGSLSDVARPWWVCAGDTLDRDKAWAVLLEWSGRGLAGRFGSPHAVAQALRSARKSTQQVLPTTEQIEAVLGSGE